MNVQINTAKNENGMAFFDLSCGKQRAQILTDKYGVMVCCMNASHRAWGGIGKRFGNLAAALENYKSSSMKAMIETAGELLAAEAIGAAA